MNLILISHLIIIIAALFSIIYTFGVVWRVEKRLDISYKLLLVSIISFTASEIIAISLPDMTTFGETIIIILKLIFIIFFLAGILEMRDMLRKMDGEIKK